MAFLPVGVMLAGTGERPARFEGAREMVAHLGESGRIHCGPPVGQSVAMLRRTADPD
jgi:hypothetical protein